MQTLLELPATPVSQTAGVPPAIAPAVAPVASPPNTAPQAIARVAPSSVLPSDEHDRLRQQEPHHHKVLGALLVVGGAALVGVGAIAFSQSCPIEQRAQQISQEIGQPVIAGGCGPSFLQQHKNAVGASATATGAGLVVSGVVLLLK